MPELPRVRLEGASVQASPLEGTTEKVRFTVPARPSRLVTVRVEVSGVPAETVMIVGKAVIVKSWTVMVTVAEWDNDPLVPVILT